MTEASEPSLRTTAAAEPASSTNGDHAASSSTPTTAEPASSTAAPPSTSATPSSPAPVQTSQPSSSDSQPDAASSPSSHPPPSADGGEEPAAKRQRKRKSLWDQPSPAGAASALPPAAFPTPSTLPLNPLFAQLQSQLALLPQLSFSTPHLSASHALSSPTTASRLDRRIYVGSLAYDIPEDTVRVIFEPFGPVAKVDMPKEPGHFPVRSKGFCLTGDHGVLTRAGWRSIRTIAVGDAVMSFNRATSATEWKKVTATQRFQPTPTGARQLFRMQGGDMDVVATADHRMLTGLLSGRHHLVAGSVDYETVRKLLSLPFIAAKKVKESLSEFEYTAARVVVRAGLNLQPAFQLVIPGMERTCALWWQIDQQCGFLRFVGFWLGDGHLAVEKGAVCISQRKLESTAWLIDLLDEVFPRWWRRQPNTYDVLKFEYTLRCPPLYEWLRVMAVGPKGYNPMAPAQLRAYPHFDSDAQLEEAESRHPTRQQRPTVGRWTEAEMLSALRGGTARRPCCVCGDVSGERLTCCGANCSKVDDITRAHPACVGRAKAEWKKPWYCRRCSGEEAEEQWAAGSPASTEAEPVSAPSPAKRQRVRRGSAPVVLPSQRTSAAEDEAEEDEKGEAQAADEVMPREQRTRSGRLSSAPTLPLSDVKESPEEEGEEDDVPGDDDDEDADDVADSQCCWRCGDAEWEVGNEILLCDGQDCRCCEHVQCADLDEAPVGEWLCPECRVKAEAATAAAAESAPTSPTRSPRRLSLSASSSSSLSPAPSALPRRVIASAFGDFGADFDDDVSMGEAVRERHMCVVCFDEKGQDDMLLCVVCEGAWHYHCLGLKRAALQQGDWYCTDRCRMRRLGARGLRGGADVPDDAAPVVAVAVAQQMAATGLVWNGGVFDIDKDGTWFYRKRWMGPNVAGTFANLSQSQAVALLEGFCRADGRWASIRFDANGEPKGPWVCSNSSFPLIDHLQLIGALAGGAVDVRRVVKAGKVSSGFVGRPAATKVDHWTLTVNFTKLYRAPVPVAQLARPVPATDIDARGYYDYKDDGLVYDISVEDNGNFLTQRLSIKRHLGKRGALVAGADVRAHPLFVGNCFVEFEGVDSAKAALMTMNGVPLRGRPMKVGKPTGGAGSEYGSFLSQLLQGGAGTAGALAGQQLNPTAMAAIQAAQIASGGTFNPATLTQLPAFALPGMVGAAGDRIPGSVGASTAKTRIYVGSLMWELTEEAVRAIFEPFGAIKSCQLILNPETGKHRGYGFVEFVEEKSAAHAIAEMDGFELIGRKLKVNYASALVAPQSSHQASPFSAPTLPPGFVIPTLPVSLGGAPAAAPQTSLGAEDNLRIHSHEQRASIMQKLSDSGRQSPVLLLKNLVAPSEVDPELNAEVAEECAKFGRVKEVKVVPDVAGNVVRVYVCFDTAAECGRAVEGLNGRYFDKRAVSAEFYPEVRYHAQIFTDA